MKGIDDYRKRKETIVEEKRKRHTKCLNCKRKMKKGDLTISVYVEKGENKILAGSFCNKICQEEYELVKMERKYGKNW